MLWRGIRASRSFVRREQSGGWEGTERWMGGNGAVDGRKRSGGWEVSDRLYSAVGEKSIDFLKILYRLSSDTL